MCVAVIIQSEKTIPKEHLKAMAEQNPHGGGVAWAEGDQIHFRKGLTWEDVDALQDYLPRPFLLHFRIATKGGKTPELTHPFPLGLQAFSDDLVGMAPAVLIHNGTWSGYREWKLPEGIKDADTSDTQIAAYVAKWHPEILDDVKWSNAVMSAGGANPDITTRGNWTEFQGNKYSNLIWLQEIPGYWSAYAKGEYPGARSGNYIGKYGGNSYTYSDRDGYDWDPPTPARNLTVVKSHQKGRTHIPEPRGKGRSAGQRQGNGKTMEENRKASRKEQAKQARARARMARRKTLEIPTMTPANSDIPTLGNAYDAAKKLWEKGRTSPDNTGYPRPSMPIIGGFDSRPSMPITGIADRAYDRKVSIESLQKTERLFTEAEKAGWVPIKPTSAFDLTKAPLNASVKCPDCDEEIEQIPCECQEFLKQIDDELEAEVKALEALEAKLESLESDDLDLNDVEDMNANGETYPSVQPSHSAYDGSDDHEAPMQVGMGLGADYLDPDWAEVDATIRAQGIKI